MEKPDFKNIESEKMTNRQVLGLVNDLVSITGIRGLKINSAIITTAENLKPYVIKLQQDKLIPTPERIKEYREKARKLFEEFSKNESGVPQKKMVGDQEVFDVDAKNPELIRQSSELDFEYKKDIDAYNKEIEEYNEYMKQECDFDVEKLIVRIEAKTLPSDISTENFVKIRHILKSFNIE